MTWKIVTEDRYDLVRDWTRPQSYERSFEGWLGGDPHTTDLETGDQTYSAVVEIDGRHYESIDPMTLAEFNRLTRAGVIEQIGVAG